MTQLHASPDELALPRVRPYRALKRIALLLLITVIALAALWFAWDRRTRRRIESRVAEYRQRNEPTRLAEFARATPLPDDRDALYHLRRAAAALPNPMPQDFINWELNFSLTIDGPMQRRGRAFVAATARGLDLIRPALTCTDANWRAPAHDGYEFDRWIHPLITASTLAHQDGDDDAALRHALDAMTLNRIAAGNPSWRAQVSRVQCDANLWAHLEALVQPIRIERPGVPKVTEDPRSPATRAHLNQLLAALLDEPATAGANKHALYAARCDLIENPAAYLAVRRPLRFWNDQSPPTPWWTPFHRLATPYVRRVTADELDDLSAVIRATEQPTLPAAVRYFPRPPGAPATAGIYAADVLERNLQTYPISALVISEFRTLRQRRLTAIFLAGRLFSIDHPDRKLTTLRDLVPQYLPQLPTDPMTGVPSWTVPTPPAPSIPAPQ
jgi:hypothetical protein